MDPPAINVGETRSRSEPLLFSITEALAEHEGVAQTELEPPLGDVIDPEALEKLFRSGSGVGHVCFSYGDYEVRVTSEGQVRVADHVERPVR